MRAFDMRNSTGHREAIADRIEPYRFPAPKSKDAATITGMPARGQYAECIPL